MSRLSNIYSSYGKQFNIAIANTFSYSILSASNLPVNTLVVANPITTYEDTGTHSLLITDCDGNPIRLTYSIRTGNGLIENKDGSIELKIDNATIKENEYGQIYANLAYFVNANGFEIVNGKLSVTASGLPKASKNTFGVFKIDGKTILSDSGMIYVDTSNLDYATNSTHGIVSSSSNTISITSGTISVNTQKLVNASNTAFGTIKTDGNLIGADNGTITLTYSNFSLCSTDKFGLSIVDNETIAESPSGEISINASSLPVATESRYGTVKPDNETMEVTTSGELAIKNYSKIQQSILDIGTNITYLNTRIKNIETDLTNLDLYANRPTIFSFVCTGLSSTTLIKPTEYGEMPEDMPTQKVHATFIINTNCPFKLNINYLDNESPEITLYEINYNDVDVYPGVTGLLKTFQSTKRTDARITLYWLCKNYRSSINEFSLKTKVTIKATYANDDSVNKEIKYSITRYNSLYKDESGGDDEIIIGGDDGGNGQHKLKYAIDLFDTSDEGREIIRKSTYTGITDTGTILRYNVVEPKVLKEYRGQPLVDFNHGETVNIIRTNLNIETDEPIPGTSQVLIKDHLISGKLLVSPFMWNENKKQWKSTNSVELNLDSFGNIILTYLGNIIIGSDDSIIPEAIEYYLKLCGNSSLFIDLGTNNLSLGSNITARYQIVGSEEIYEKDGIFEQFISGLSLRKYVLDEPDILTQVTQNDIKIIGMYETTVEDPEQDWLENENWTNLITEINGIKAFQLRGNGIYLRKLTMNTNIAIGREQ